VELTHFIPVCLVLAFFIYIWNFDKKNNKARTSICLVGLVASIIYLHWRFTNTLFLYETELSFQQFWIYAVYFIELVGFFEIAMFLLIMSRTRDRSQDIQPIPAEQEHMYSVDIFIPTYNEPIEVLEKTIIGAKHIDWPNIKVWVLDDGHRGWLRDFCKEQEVEYLARPSNEHAKAGNLNYALQYTKGDFFCIFDADFVPFRHFLKRTLPLFKIPHVGIVQTPQHFYNKDPIQINLHVPDDYPDEQRLFFDEMAVSRDAWGMAFCCGSCSVMRRSAIDATGGIPTESVTEDLLTTLRMIRKGYITVYLNEKLSQGLAAESIRAFFVQRERWARGAVQTIYLPDGPLGPGLTLMQRIFFFPVSWLIQYPTRLLLVLIPIMYLVFGLTPLKYTEFSDLMFYQIPVFLTYFLTMRWLVRGKYLPIVSVSASLFATFRLLPAVFSSLVKPFGVPFRVTPKGLGSKETSIEYFTFFCLLVSVLSTLYGLAINIIPEWAAIPADGFFPVAVFWSLLNVLMLVIAMLMCFEGPRPRTEERFIIEEQVPVYINNSEFRGIMLESSITGCKIKLNDWWNGNLKNADMSIWVKTLGRIKLEPMRVNRGSIGAKYHFTGSQRYQLIAILFSGYYNNAVMEVTNIKMLIRNLWRRLWH
jgi:cellulose synthase (UDP-forming)